MPDQPSRYYILSLDVRNDQLDIVETKAEYVPIEMVAIQHRIRDERPYALVMVKPINANTRKQIQKLLTAIEVKGSVKI